jgi:hypothetical protein
VRPIRVTGGDFVLPGCVAGRTYQVLFLDVGRRLGAITELTAGGDEAPVVHLQTCGQASVRFVDMSGRPLANKILSPVVLLEPDWLAGGKRTARAVAYETAWADPLAYSHSLGPHTEADGRIMLTGLVPGARYSLTERDGAHNRRVAASMTVRTGEVLRLPDVVVPTPVQAPAGVVRPETGR